MQEVCAAKEVDGCKSSLGYIQGILDKMLQGGSKREGGLVSLVSLVSSYNTLRKLG